jgi:hypothetical protein
MPILGPFLAFGGQNEAHLETQPAPPFLGYHLAGRAAKYG